MIFTSKILYETIYVIFYFEESNKKLELHAIRSLLYSHVNS